MNKITYITKNEHDKCKKVVQAYAELFESEDIVVLDAGKYGFIKLRYYNPVYGFGSMEIYVNSKKLFDSLWEDWFNAQLFSLRTQNTDEDIEFEKIFCNLPFYKQKELLDKRSYFENKVNE